MNEQPKTRSGGGLPRARARFLAQAIQLEERGPSGVASAAVFLIIFLLGAGVAWSAVTRVNETTRAPGEVIPAGLNVSIQHLEGGLVEAIQVRDGDAVRKGDLLLSLDPTLGRSELEQMRIRQAALQLESERLSALLTGREPDFGEPGAQYPLLADKQRTLYQAQKTSQEREVAVLDAQIRQREEELVRQRNEVRSLEKEVAPLAELLRLRVTLQEKQLLGRGEVLSLETRLAEAKGDLRRARDGVAVAVSSLDGARQQRLELDARFFRELEVEASRVVGELAEVSQSLVRLADRVRRSAVVAPVDGIVQGLKINSRNAVIEPGRVIMQIVPIDDEMVVEARVSPADIGHIHIGQAADVRVDSYDAARFGTVPGTVRRLSATTYMDEKQQPYYRAEIALSRDHLGERAGELRIIPGMTVVAAIRTGSKTVLDYLLKPIRRGLDNAFAER
jgi:HlyD family type I secretion membrane fusion protein